MCISMVVMVVAENLKTRNIYSIEKSSKIRPSRPYAADDGYLPGGTPMMYAIENNYRSTAGGYAELSARLKRRRLSKESKSRG